MVAPFAVYPKSTVDVRMLPIAKTLVKRGHKVVIVIPPYDNPSYSGVEYEVDGVRISNVVFRDLSLVKFVLVPLRIVRKVLSLKPDVVYVFKPKGYSGLVAMLLAAMRRLGFLTKAGLVLDTDDWEGYGGFNDYYLSHSAYPKVMLDFFDFQERWIPRHVDAVTVASKTLEERTLQMGLSRDKVFYVPNGAFRQALSVDSERVDALKLRLGLADRSVILLYTRFFEYSVERVVKILDCIRKGFGDVRLLVVGSGDFREEEKLKDLASEAEVDDLLVLAGWVRPDEIPDYLAVGQIAIYPFDDTPLNRAKCPRKLIELMTAGKSIVAERVGQIAEYIENEESGLLVDSGDIEGLTSAVVRILKDRC